MALSTSLHDTGGFFGSDKIGHMMRQRTSPRINQSEMATKTAKKPNSNTEKNQQPSAEAIPAKNCDDLSKEKVSENEIRD